MTYQLLNLPVAAGKKYFRSKLHISFGDDLKGLVAYKDNEIAAVVGLHDWTDTACFAHWVIDKPLVLRHGFFEAVADYVFRQTGRDKIFGKITTQNVRSLRLAKHIGFTELCRMKDGYRKGVDMVLVELTKENCRYL